MHGPFSCPFVRNLPSVPVRLIPTPIFTNVFDHRTTETWVPLTSNTSPCGKELLANRDGIVIAEFSCMGWICQHCGAPFVDSAYRVKSEESGVILLDIIVCQHCYVEARDLGLHTEKIGVRHSSRARNHSSSRKKPALR
jgi:hypothetical protein